MGSQVEETGDEVVLEQSMSRRVEDISPSKHASVPLRGSKSTLTQGMNEEIRETEVCFMIEVGEPVEYPQDYFDLVK